MTLRDELTVWAVALALPFMVASPAAGQDLLTLDGAISRASATSPRLGAADANLRASYGSAEQAAMRPNPEIAVDLENFAGRRDYRGLRAVETTVGITQTLELGGKRAARRKLAAGDSRVAALELDREARDLRRDVTVAYIEVLAAEDRLALAAEQKSLAEEVAKTVRRFVRAARDPLLEESKAELALATAALGLGQAERDVAAARRTLGALLDMDTDNLVLDRGLFADGLSAPSVADLRALVPTLPDLELYEAGITRGRAAMALEKAQGVPDPRLNIGFRDFADSGATAFVMGLSMPIPVNDRNQGAIRRARQDIIRAEQNRLQAERDLMRSALDARADWVAADADRVTLEEKILPEATRAVKLARDGYNRGLFNHLQLLDAQRALHDARAEVIDNRKRARLARATLERLTAGESAE